MAVVGGVHQRSVNMQSSHPISIPVVHPSVRPSSALARGVRITEYSDGRVNPDPIVIEESDVLLEEFLSPRKLRDLTGMENLEDVHSLEMKVDTRDTSLGNFGTHLPNLSQLKLSSSIIQSVRDLGSGLDFVRVLWMSRCGLEDLESVSSMHSLREIYLSYNEISDVRPCSMLENLQILDLEGNNIDELCQVEFLALCRSLANLTLEGNPICVTPSPDQAEPLYDYRSAVHKAIPHLRILDDESLASGPLPSTKKTSVSAFEDDWRLIDELLKDATINISDDEAAESSAGRPQTARPSTAYRPGSALRPYSAALCPGSSRQRPASGLKRPGSSGRPASSESGSSKQGSSRPQSTGDDDVHDSSHLTVGAVVCGNPSKALKARLRPQIKSTNPEISRKLQEIRKQPQDVINAQLEPDEGFKEVLSEVREWKASHQKILDDIESSKAAQVFVVSHDDAVSEDEAFSASDESDCEEATFGPGRGQTPPPRIARFAPNNYTQVTRPKSRAGSAASQRSYSLYDESHDARDDGYFSRRTPEEEIEQASPSKTSFMTPTPPPKALRSPVVMKPDVRKRLPSPGSHIRQQPDSLSERPLIRSLAVNTDHPTTTASRTPDRTPPGQSSSRIRKGHLANVQLLPSKPFPK